MADRRSGRTTAQCEESLRRATAGENVIYLVANAAMINYTKRIFHGLLPSLRWDRDRATVGAGSIAIQRPNPVRQRFRGIPNLHVEVDHATWSLLDRYDGDALTEALARIEEKKP